jgi:hypothetical protein
MIDPVERRGFLTAIVAATAGLLTAGTLLAAPKTYKYKCMKCKLIHYCGTPGTKNCPHDGQTMVRQNSRSHGLRRGHWSPAED